MLSTIHETAEVVTKKSIIEKYFLSLLLSTVTTIV